MHDPFRSNFKVKINKYSAMFTASENPTITVKRKSTQTVFDYCLDNDFTFSVRRAAGKDEFEIEFEVADVKRGVLLGMFLRENRFELNGLTTAAAPAPAAPRTAAKKATNGTATATEQPAAQEQTAIAEEGLLLNLDAN
ncbi:MAG: hypothetical protein IM638_01850 [Bacteroidetes bacterium]|nr:hypothetical protein [Bacteroidota bacterium]